MRPFQTIRFFLTSAIVLLAIAGCDRETLLPDWTGNGDRELTDGFCIQFSDSILINHNQIDYYDISTHMIYLKESHDFISENDWEIGYWPFYVIAGRQLIYEGTLWPGWSSAIPTGAYIDLPFRYPGYVLKIEHPSEKWGVPADIGEPDLRSDERIITVLKKNAQYRESLTLSVDEIDTSQPGELSFTFTLTNRDNFDYYILSPDKMGLELFHYYTNGLLISYAKGTWQHQLEVESPDPWDSWSMAWTELLESGSKRTFTVHYPAFDVVSQGEHEVSFIYPGLKNVGLDEIQQAQGRIWLGELRYFSTITVE